MMKDDDDVVYLGRGEGRQSRVSHGQAADIKKKVHHVLTGAVMMMKMARWGR